MIEYIIYVFNKDHAGACFTMEMVFPSDKEVAEWCKENEGIGESIIWRKKTREDNNHPGSYRQTIYDQYMKRGKL